MLSLAGNIEYAGEVSFFPVGDGYTEFKVQFPVLFREQMRAPVGDLMAPLILVRGIFFRRLHLLLPD